MTCVGLDYTKGSLSTEDTVGLVGNCDTFTKQGADKDRSFINIKKYLAPDRDWETF